MSQQYDANGDPIPAQDVLQPQGEQTIYDANGDPIKRPTPPSGWQQAYNIIKSVLAGAAKIPGQLTHGVGGLVAKGTDKLGLTQGAEEKSREGGQKLEAGIDKALGVDPNQYNGAELLGNVGGQLFIPAGKVAEPIEAGSEALMNLLKLGKAAKPAAQIATSGALNAGLGAAQGEESGNAGQGALMGLLGGAGMTAGAKGLGALSEEVAPRMLEFGANPTKTMQMGMNPPTKAGFKEVLNEGLVPVFGGYKAAAEKIGDALSADNATRAGIMDASGTKVNIAGAIATAKQGIADDIASGGKGGLTPHDADMAEKWFDDYAKQAKASPNYNNGWLPASEAMQLKTSAAKNAKFIAGETPEGRPLASERYSGAIRNQIENLMAGKPNADEFTAVNDRMARMAPVQNAIENRSYANGMGPWEVAGLGASAAALPIEAMSGHPMAAAATSLFPIWEVVKHDPGAAAALYKIGQRFNALGNGQRLIPMETLMQQYQQQGNQ